MNKYTIVLIIILFVILFFLMVNKKLFNFNYCQENYTSAKRFFESRCTNLDFKKCLQTSQCGWLIDDEQSRCLQGTPIGPLNPKLQPDAENSFKKNTQYDRWIFNNINPFITFN